MDQQRLDNHNLKKPFIINKGRRFKPVLFIFFSLKYFRIVMNILYSILRNDWAIEANYASAQLPFILSMMNGSYTHENVEAPASPYTVQAVSTHNNKSSQSQQFIQVIPIENAITRDGTLCTIGAVQIAQHIKEADNNQDISAIILAINSPGGEARGAFILAEAIRQANKPVIAHIAHGMAASAAYWAASQADEVYVQHEFDEVGSIGAFVQLVSNKNKLEKEGWVIKTIYAPQSTDKNGDVRAALEDNDTSKIEAHLSELVEAFFADVNIGRGKKLKNNDWQTGKLYKAKEAQNLGLIDGIQSFQASIDRANFLTQTKNKKSKMENLPKLQALLGWEGIESNADGIYLSEDDAKIVEANLADEATQAQCIADLKSEASALNTTIEQKEAALAEAQQTIAEWEQKYNALKGSPAPDVTPTPTSGDNGDNNPQSLDEVTQQAMRIYQQHN